MTLVERSSLCTRMICLIPVADHLEAWSTRGETVRGVVGTEERNPERKGAKMGEGRRRRHEKTLLLLTWTREKSEAPEEEGGQTA